jgi:hypothetical protein
MPRCRYKIPAGVLERWSVGTNVRLPFEGRERGGVVGFGCRNLILKRRRGFALLLNSGSILLNRDE